MKILGYVFTAILIFLGFERYGYSALRFQKFKTQLQKSPVEVFIVTEDDKGASVKWVAVPSSKSNFPAPGADIPELASRYHLKTAVNANFYAEDRPREQVPIGLVIHDGKILSSPKRSYPSIGIIDGKLEWDIVSMSNGKLHGERFGSKWASVREAVSGSHVLIQGKTYPSVRRPWALTKQPRTMIGVDAANHVWVAVFDGRRESSQGVSIQEAWKFVQKKIKAKWALNLDGGGSTTLVYDGRLLNKPSDLYPRPVAVGFGARE